MRLLLISLSLVLIASFFTSCTEEFYPETTNYQELLVVDGLVTNDTGAYVVTLRRSMPLGVNKPKMESGAIVEIESSDGTLVNLTEVSNGTYSTQGTDFRGQIGQSYRLHIVTNNGKEYFSHYESLAAPTDIDQLNWDFETDTEEGTGVRIFVSSHLTDSLQFLRWEYEETWESVPAFLFDTLPQNAFIEAPNEYPEKDNYPNICYTSQKSSDLFIASTESYTENRVLQKPLAFVSASTSKLLYKYCITVNQYSMSKAQYQFWKALADSESEEGSMYDSYPNPIKGNIYSVDNPDEPVLGGFFASPVSQKRIFIRNQDIRTRIIYISNPFSCIYMSRGITTDIQKINGDTLTYLTSRIAAINKQLRTLTPGTPEYISLTSERSQLNVTLTRFNQILKTIDDLEIETGGMYVGTSCERGMGGGVSCTANFVISTVCFDCRRFGTETKPDFWIE